MHQLLEALIDETGRVFLLEPVRFPQKRRALVVVLDDAILNVPPVVAAESVPPTSTVPSGLRTPEGAARYRIDRPLGAGGMGQTFVGTDIATGQVVCIKQFRPDVRPQMILLEWKALSRIQSPHVARFLDRYEHESKPHLVMEYVHGPTLRDRLKTSGLTTTECLWLGLCLLHGARAFHELDVIHCDLKPANIVLQDVTTLAPSPHAAWIPKIIDFGIAILDRHDAEGNLTAERRIAGTPLYMAPEQARGEMLSPACDVYAIGLILWEAVCGRAAFGTTNTSELMLAKMTQQEGFRLDPQSPVPRAFADLIEQCTHPLPNERPTTTEAIRQLEVCLEEFSGPLT